MHPKFGRRSWVKLWVNEWLDGTTRLEMSDAQRAFWIDLLAMAGRSRYPGRICAGVIDGQFVGYPLSKFQSLMTTPLKIEETLRLFERHGKAKVTVTTREPMRLFMVELLNWEKFQSEYQRQKKYRTKTHGDTQVTPRSDSQSNRTEVEGEGEVETDTEEKRRRTAAAFTALHFDEPFGQRVFQKVWLKHYAAATENGAWLTGAMERAIQECQDRGIAVPPQFYQVKRAIEDEENRAFAAGQRKK